MRTKFLISLRLLIMCTVITGIVYPLLMTGFAFLAFPERSQGSIVQTNGAAVGSALIGQSFTSPMYFHGRASAGGYDPMVSGASNYGPTNQFLRDSIAARRARFVTENWLTSGDLVPADMLTASGSGLDPEISPEAAMLQTTRIARSRHFTTAQEAALSSLVKQSTLGPEFGFFGKPRVNVLLLNVALDAMSR